MEISKLKHSLESQPNYRFSQAMQAIFKDLIDDWAQASTFPKDLRESLTEQFPLEIKHQLFNSKDSRTTKALLELSDGQKIETVLMRTEKRNTVCVSSQVGCPLNCSFCATGQMGFKRNLTKDEIIDQIMLFSRLLKKENKKITNIVYMGMGEPFLNYDNVLSSIKFLNDPNTLNIGARHFSISTSGIAEGILKLAEEPLEVNLALSLHAADDELRSHLMPINQKYPLNEVFTALRKYQNKTRRKIMFEYMMIAGINDSELQAHALANLVKGMICMINFIPYNPTGRFKPSSESQIKTFKKILEAHHLEVVQRYSQGGDIAGACGQLANKNK